MERYGMHRSVRPRRVLPQQAEVLDPHGPLAADELAVDVDYLNVDAASWHQLRSACDDDRAAMERSLLEIVRSRGKLHNPTTGSGGMLVGTVAELGGDRRVPPVGTRIATLVSLTLTPLALEEIVHLDPKSEKVAVRGRAILFGSGIYAEVPSDLPDETVLGTLDVCGAPAWMARLARPGMNVVVMGGGGKAGVLSCAQAVRTLRGNGRVLALCWPKETAIAATEAGAEAIAVDCTDAAAVHAAVTGALGGRESDLVFACASVPGCEGAAILACSDEGRIVFFSMATSFAAAALTAEGLGKSCEMTIGNGYVRGHAELALDLIRSDPHLAQRMSA